MLYIASIIQSIGFINFVLRAVVALCGLFLIFAIFTGLAFLMGFH